MPFNSLTSRTDAAALIPEDVSREIIQSVPEASAFLSLARRLPNMSRKQTRMPVLSALPTAYFVTGDTGLKQTTEIAWDNKYLNAEEIAVICPIPEVVLDDADYDIWGEIRPKLIEEFGRVIDAAVLFGTNAPTDWPDDVRTAAVAASNNLALGGGGVDLYDDILGPTGIVSLVEADGYMVNGYIAAMSMRGRLRGIRADNGIPIFTGSMQQANSYFLDGAPILFPRNGAFATAATYMFGGDFSQLVYSMRQDMTYKLLTEAVITDAGGNIIYNLAQQDMVALRAVMRIAWQCPNPINRLQSTEASRYPVAVLTT